MGIDQVAELMRHVLLEALIISAPILIAASLTSFALSLLQTLTSLQDQSLTTVPRLLVVVLLMLVGMPWFLKRMVMYAVALCSDFHQFLS